MDICLTSNCNNQAFPGSDYCLSCLSRQNGHGNDGAAMIIPPINMIEPSVLQIDDLSEDALLLAFAELNARIPRIKAELNRQREQYQIQKGKLISAEYANEQQDDTIRQMTETIERQAEIIRWQQVRLDRRWHAIRTLRQQRHAMFKTLEFEHGYAEGLSLQLDQARNNLMQVPFVGNNGQGEWAQSAPDDVAPLEDGFRAEYAKLDPETFEVSQLFWFRAE